jgi:predicted DNA-binding transcriptional regulator YafY
MRLRERFLVDAPGWFERAEPPPMLERVSGALWDGRRVQLRYQRDERVVRRVVDPLGLVMKGSRWYLVARARRPDGLRTYRVDRIRGARVLDDHVERPRDFDLASAWAEVGRGFDRHLRRVEVAIAMAPAQAWRLRHALTPPAAEEALASQVPLADGRVRMEVRAESVEVAHDELLRLGSHVEVVAPAELRSMLETTGEALARAHRRIRRGPTAAS